jgi:hypothetical protein
MSPNDHEDQEFDDFLQGKGELAQQLKSLSQPQPSEALTQAILARVQRDLEQPEAANAPSFSGVARPGWIRRMRVPLTLAASVTLGIAATMLWRDTEAPATPVSAQAPASSTNDKPEQVASANIPATPATPSTAPAPQHIVPPSEAKIVAPATPVTAQAPASSANDKPEQIAAVNSPSAPVASAAMPVHQHVAPTPSVVVAQADPPTINDNAVVMRSVPIPETGPDTPPQAWLSIIATLIRQDQRDEALLQWNKFRQTHPQYAVPDAVQAQIDALKK